MKQQLNDISPIAALLGDCMVGIPEQPISLPVLIEKYAKGEENSVDQVRERVAAAIAAMEKPADQDYWKEVFYLAQRAGLIPAGRIASAAGTDLMATLINCFVQPISDSITGSAQAVSVVNGKAVPGATKVGIYDALAEAAETMRRGGGVGYDFSQIRPRGAYVKSTNSTASGPVSYMKVFDKSCETVESAGARRGAQMGALRIDHPDILEFIDAKLVKSLSNFNLSVGVRDAFMHALEQDEEIELWHAAMPRDTSKAYQREDGMWVYKKVKASEIWNRIMKNTYDAAEPGVLFLDRINTDNNLSYCEVIETTNPCGEQPLPDYGCCDLGAINLPQLVRDPFTPQAKFDFAAYAALIRIGVRLLDNVLDATVWPLEKQKAEAMAKRRVGLGFTGLGDALIMLGLPYNSAEGAEMARKIAEFKRNTAYMASVELAKEKGPFPLFDAEKYLSNGTFASRLPDDIKQAIREHGIRNSHLLSIAPTGTISLAFAGNASNGIEPAFSWFYTRTKREGDGSKVDYLVEDLAYAIYRRMKGIGDKVEVVPFCSESSVEPGTVYQEGGVDKVMLPAAFVSALEMSAGAHLTVLKEVAPYIDTAISKTINVPEEYPFEDFVGIYMQAWKAGVKGVTTYRPNSITGAVLSVDKPKAEGQEAAAAPVEPVLVDEDPIRKPIAKRPDGALPAVNIKMRYKSNWEPKSLYISVAFMEVDGVHEGKPVKIERPIEFFLPAGQSEETTEWVSACMRMLSLSARGGFAAEALANLRQVAGNGNVQFGEIVKPDGERVPRTHRSEVAAIAFGIQQYLADVGFLDADGNQVPVRVLAKQYAQKCNGLNVVEVTPESDMVGADSGIAPKNKVMAGKECKSCGARAVIRKDGCEFCTHCGEVGACG